MPSASDPGPLLLATRSAHKAAEIRRILRGLDLLTLDQAGIAETPDEDRIEAFDTFSANALAKARFFARRSGLRALADDSGIRVDALDGRPGVRSKRFAGRTDLLGEALDRANNAHLIAELRRSRSPRRDAHYVCAAVLAGPDGAHTLAIASCTGSILDSPRGTLGFGYDPHFLVPALGLTFAELGPDAKNAISHRGRAFRALAASLS